MRVLQGCAALVFSSAMMIGCGNSAPAPAEGAKSSTVNSKYLLASEPAGPLSVIEARKSAKDSAEIVLLGRIGGDVKPWVEGRASFLIVDESLKPCSEIPGDDCETPWDYCCDTDRLPKAKATIKFVNDKGETLPTDARQLLGVKELQRVIVQGKAKRDDAGNLVVLASGIFVKN